ncbi:hypothetical protein AMTR_s00049p00171530 [Amborella trichopoda]|uniref:Uncharacterized protein n=1 Tax=Amborella trichopoda TaxID=13333 RepID=W1PZW8_AMBTC|nr:hypothetical protein AMTR_s00049p00171530 [Amborella trichopoda]
MMNKISGPVLIFGSRIHLPSYDEEGRRVIDDKDDKVSELLRYKIEVKPPKDMSKRVKWMLSVVHEMTVIKAQDHRNHIAKFLNANDIDCDDLDSICVNQNTEILRSNIEEIVVCALITC